jgi:hypothetical protein
MLGKYLSKRKVFERAGCGERMAAEHPRKRLSKLILDSSL